MTMPPDENFLLPVTPASAPDPVTPNQGPAVPGAYDKVTPPGSGPANAPYDIAAPQDDLTAVTEAAGRLAGGGVVYPSGPRQSETLAILQSPAGTTADQDVLAGFPDYESADIKPATDDPQTPIQGTGTLGGPGIPPEVGTAQEGLPVYSAGEHGGTDAGVLGGVQGVSDVSGQPQYPGTTQDGLTKYGTTG